MVRNKKLFGLVCFFCFLLITVNAQLFENVKLPESRLRVVKTGPLLGLEYGKYVNFNFGMERQYQQLKLVRPQTHAVNVQFDYNFSYRVMGAQVGYWFKIGRLDLTYGARLGWHTDYDAHRYSFSPNVGYKLLQAHLQLGYNVMGRNDSFTEVNTFYASVRWVFINNRDFKRKKKKD